ncbi:MAG: tRNA (N(6)-L-threonylcarbamoyladenosine(37)-C(2))-methylthiotransferase [Candidatus Altiarchaeota archaeon]
MVEYVETYGCALNQADSETIHGLLEEHGLGESGVVVVNTCTVKSPTENKILKKLREYESEGRRVVVAGCLPAARPGVADEFPSFSFIGTNTGDIVEAVSATAVGERYVNISGPGEKIGLPHVNENPVVGIVPISEGCLGGCSYCLTKKARGRLKSYSVDGIVRRIGEFASKGVREIWLTSQDTGAYGRDVGCDLVELLNAVCMVEGDFKVRVGMMNPNYALEMLDGLIDAYRNVKIYRFAHIPVQSGSDKVLEEMNRRYCVRDFKRIAERFREELNATISTDVIAGYPTETTEEFDKTVRLIRELKPDVLNVSRYWPRPGTEAASLKQLPGRETKRRSSIIVDLFRETGLERNRWWIGWNGECIASKDNGDGTYTARNDWYKPIIVDGEGLLGNNLMVEVTEATYYDLRGEIT